LQLHGDELDYDGKLRILDHLAGFEVKLDLSGGDALVTNDGLPLLQVCSSRLGRSNVTLTVTGAGVRRNLIEPVSQLIGELNFTFDAASPADATVRPDNYAASNLKLAISMRSAGVATRAECPLTKSAAQPEHLTRLYMQLVDAGIDKLLIMRHFPVGRGSVLPEYIPSRDEYLSAITTLRELEARYARPAVHLQCALRHIEFSSQKLPSNPCDLGRVSYGLMADGTLLASPWAVAENGKPLHPCWVLGNLAQTPLSEILRSVDSQTILKRADDNFGECKIFSFLYSRHPNPVERIFDKADPLYSAAATSVQI
jgi:MoaA/NifB/PqqE/SkfB family radical SAM enzyme